MMTPCGRRQLGGGGENGRAGVRQGQLGVPLSYPYLHFATDKKYFLKNQKFLGFSHVS
jgi:hypothetical protein